MQGLFIDKVCGYSRLHAFKKRKLVASIKDADKKLYQFVDDYFRDYCNYYDIDAFDAYNIIEKFSINYSKSIHDFINSGKYPIEQEKYQQMDLDRIEYDIILISSYLLELHRFNILKWIAQEDYFNKRILAIGIGSGVEIALIIDFLGFQCFIRGYDLNYSDYVSNRYGNILKGEYFTSSDEMYEVAMLIEILEHVSSPINLLRMASESIISGGVIYLTTAIDIPQFDHLYNFKRGEIINFIKKLDLEIVYMKEIMHSHIISGISSSNELVKAVKL